MCFFPKKSYGKGVDPPPLYGKFHKKNVFFYWNLPLLSFYFPPKRKDHLKSISKQCNNLLLYTDVVKSACGNIYPESMEYFCKTMRVSYKYVKTIQNVWFKYHYDLFFKIIPQNTLIFGYSYKLGLHLSAFYVNLDAGYPASLQEFPKFECRQAGIICLFPSLAV